MNQDHRIKVAITTRVRTDIGERATRLVAISPKTALLFAPEAIGTVGHCVDVVLPALEHELVVTAGIERIEKVVEGFAVTVRFMVADNTLRCSLNELLTLLLAGSGGGARKHPRIVYEAPIDIGEDFAQRGMLEEISLSGMSLRVRKPLPGDARLTVRVPQISHRPAVVLVGRVVNQRPSPEGGYSTGLAFDSLRAPERMALSALLADLMSR